MPKKPPAKRAGRPLTESKPLTHSANVRLNDEDYRAFTTMADDMSTRVGARVSLSAWLRMAGRAYINHTVRPVAK